MTLLLLACVDYDLNPDKVDPEPGEVVDTGAPRLLVEPLTLAFGQQLLGSETAESVVLTNIGTELLTLDPPELESAYPFDVAGQSSEIEPGESVVWTVTWGPEAYVGGTGELKVWSDGGDEVVDLSGDTLRPAIALSPTNHDFGTVDVGQTQLVEVLIESVGEAPLTLGVQDWVTTSAGELVHIPTTETVLYPSQSTLVTVLFAPADEGAEEATYTVWSDDPTSPATSAGFYGSGLPNGPWEVAFSGSADDAWEGWIDGVSLGSHSGWSTVDTYTRTLAAGDHVIAVHAKDVASVIAGFIGMVEVDGQPFSLTSDGSWLMTGSSPSGSWQDIGYNSSSWTTPPKCADTSPWGSNPSVLKSAGADWIWHNSNCRALGQAWFRLEFTL